MENNNIQKFNQFSNKNMELEAIEIINKYDYLKKAFKYIILNNKSNSNPYHDLNHLLTVMKYSYQGAMYENLNEQETKELLLTAIFHDVNHSGGKKSDSENIKIAKKSIKDFVEIEEIDVNIDIINDILDATEFPYTIDSKDLNISQAIIRDADIMQIYEYNWISQNILGLASELNMSFIEFLDGQEKFMNNVSFNTEWGQNSKKEKWSYITEKFEMLKEACMIELNSEK